MGRIKNEELYILDQTVSGNDRLIGSDGDDLKKTKNFSVDDLLAYIQANTPSDYVLPTASVSVLGGIKIDNTTLTIDEGGVLSVVEQYQPSGLEEITENGATGWRFIGEIPGDNINRYFIGNKAIDGMQFRGDGVGRPDIPTLPYGTRSVDGINFGVDNKDNADFNTTVIGVVNQTNAYAFATMIGGFNNIGYGYGDVCIGTYNTTNPSYITSFLFAMGHNVRMNGEQGGVGLGVAITHNSKGAVVVGTSNVPWAGGVSASNRPAFTVGIGTTTTPEGRWEPLIQKDGLNVLFTGEVIANSTTNALIDAEATGKILTTKEWVEAQGFGVAPTYTEYVANITQSSTLAPTAVVLGNELSGAIVWTRSGVGSYRGTLIGEFPVDKVVVTLGGNRTFPETTIRAYRSSDDEITILTNFQSGTLDGVLNNTSIIIRVYP